MGPVHVLQLPVSLYVFPSFSLHVGHFINNLVESCSIEQLTLQSGYLSRLVLTVIFPIYIWFIFSFLHNKMPRIFMHMNRSWNNPGLTWCFQYVYNRYAFIIYIVWKPGCAASLTSLYLGFYIIIASFWDTFIHIYLDNINCMIVQNRSVNNY